MKGRTKGTPKTGGREPGTPNKITTDLRECIKSFLESNITSLQHEFDTLEAKDKLRFIIELLPYVVPKLQNTKIDFEGNEDTFTLGKVRTTGEEAPVYIFNHNGIMPIIV